MKRVAAAGGEGASVVPLVHAYLAPTPENEVAAAAGDQLTTALR